LCRSLATMLSVCPLSLHDALPISFMFAPAAVASMPLHIFAVVPFADDLTLFGRRVPMVVSVLNVGLLYVLGLSSINVYGIALGRSEEHTSELQSRENLVCRLLPEK